MADRPEIDEARRIATILENVEAAKRGIRTEDLILLARAFLALLGKQSERDAIVREALVQSYCAADAGRSPSLETRRLYSKALGLLAPLPEQSEEEAPASWAGPVPPEDVERATEYVKKRGWVADAD